MKIVEQLPEYIRNLIPYEPGKPIEEVEREYGIANSTKLASNENPLGPSPKALAAIRAKLDQLHLYPDGDCFYLKNGLAKKLGVAPDELIFGNGSNEIIEFIGHALIQPGVDVVVSQYCFAVYPIVTKLFGGNLITVPARNYGHDLNAMLEAVTPNTRVMFV
ncbi:MAG: aminotransferase class I/II-fold pyridoxal phosphate-dependent enzyme, partial [Candidatus Binatia bacterium]